ncbi:MAG: diguanylate cyclase, partial [Candidatus Heimdallarchaeota archaeon]|nr:diguanylate cyclase [Candidatus Heimdallarchaeota archaeon]
MKSVPYFLLLLNAGLFLPLGIIIPLVEKKEILESEFKRTQMRFIFICVSFCGVSIILNFLSGSTALYPIGVGLLAFSSMLIGYAIVNYRLLSFDLLVHKAAVIFFSLAPLSGVHFIISRIFFRGVDNTISAGFALIVIAYIILFTPYKSYVKKISDRIVWRGKYDYQAVMAEMSQNLMSILDVEQLLNYIVQAIVQTFDAEQVVILLENDENRSFSVQAWHGIAVDTQSLSIPFNDQLILRLRSNDDILLKEEMGLSESLFEVERVFKSITLLEAELVLPFLFKERLMGCVVLGKRKSSLIYNQGDIDALSNFVVKAAAAIENARLYDEAIIDPQTKVFNHNYFLMRVGEEVSRCKRYGHPMALLMIEIDNFKDFDEEYGRQVGDLILKNIGALLKHKLRSVDILARCTGGQFAIILPETASSQAQGPAEVIR